jgi:hypothetical protein
LKIKPCIPLCLLLLVLATCAAQPAAPTPQPPSTQKTVLKTAVGDLVYVSARTVKEVNGTAATPGTKILLVILERLDKSAIDLQAFQNAQKEIFVQGDDGSNTMNTMAGMVGKNYEDFAIGFMVPEAVKTYTLTWDKNPPLEIGAVE